METADQILEGLNDAQREAVLANQGAVLILAGAGSGKTRAITRKIAWLVSQEGYAPWQILAVTFTNKAAGEMRERCHELLGSAADDLWLGTFHRIGVRILRTHGTLVGVPQSFIIYDSDDQKAMVGRAIEAAGLSKERYEPKALQGFINRAKQRNLSPDQVAEVDAIEPTDPWLTIYAAYETEMRAAGAVDFADLLMLPLRIMTTQPLVQSEYKQRWRYVLVDEFQDTNVVQYQFLMAVLNDAKRICVVGDDDQSIYRWRGAEVENILGFDRALPEVTVIRLERNYRCSGNILNVASALISQNRTRHAKALWTEKPAGEPVRVHVAPTDNAEAAYIAREVLALQGRTSLREIAVFYRTHAQSRTLEDAFRQWGVPYAIVGGLRFYERAEVKDALAYLRVLLNPQDIISWERIINTPPRGIGRVTVAAIHERAGRQGATFWEACQQLAEGGTASQKKKLGGFVTLIRSLQDIAQSGTALDVAEAILEQTGYLTRLKAQRSAEADARLENLQELMNAIDEFSDRTEDTGLAAYLEQVSLVADIDRAQMGTAADDRLVMMTAHTAKGLEFDVVFLTGMEHGLFPHFNSLEEIGGIEEERRLAYVAMTRARERLTLTRAEVRRRYGQTAMALPSNMLDGLPREAMAFTEPPTPTWSERRHAPGGGSEWNSPPAEDFDQSMPSYEEFSQEPQSMAPASLVFHATFGEGRVLNINGEGPHAKVKVRFSDGAVKTLLARFLTPA
jgi:DNA helicase II / ATP-dependent DNA helicase PcrA